MPDAGHIRETQDNCADGCHVYRRVGVWGGVLMCRCGKIAEWEPWWDRTPSITPTWPPDHTGMHRRPPGRDRRHRDSVWLLMAQDGRRDCFESWAPIQAFLHQPTTLEVGRVLVAHLPDWPEHPWVGADRPRRIMDFCQVIQVPVRAARGAADA